MQISSLIDMFTSLRVSETIRNPEENIVGSFASDFLTAVCCQKSIRHCNKSPAVFNTTSELLIP